MAGGVADAGAGMGNSEMGDRFGLWTVTGPITRGCYPKVPCRCDCGTERDVDVRSLIKGKSTRCRKCSNANNEKANVARRRPISVGEKVGLWTVLGEAGTRDGNLYMKCRCECGAEHEVMASTMRHGKSKSCPVCAQAMSIAEKRDLAVKHGGVSPEYRAWSRMISRCHNSKDRGFKGYGSRGIKVCDEWRGKGGFQRFLTHIGLRPSQDHSIDRKKNDDGYEPDNVRWATRKEQQRNTRRNRLVTIDGVTKCVAEWAEESSISGATIRSRLYRGWSSKDAVFTPSKRL